jgi:hypothetical protein
MMGSSTIAESDHAEKKNGAHCKRCRLRHVRKADAVGGGEGIQRRNITSRRRFAQVLVEVLRKIAEFHTVGDAFQIGVAQRFSRSVSPTGLLR